MDDERRPLHPNIEEVLPDYAIGALDDGEMATIEAHLDGCAACQAALDNVLVVSGMLAMASPRPAVKLALLERLPRREALPAPLGTPSVASSPATAVARPVAPVEVFPVTAFAAAARDRQRWRPGRLGLVAAVFALVVGLAGWNLRLQRDLDRVRDEESIAGLVGDGAVVSALGDTQSQTGTSGLLYADPGSDTALLVANDLPPLAEGQEFQVWLFTADDDRVVGSRFTAGTGSDAVVSLTAPGTFADYVSIAVTAEPPGVTEPSGSLTLGGWLGGPVPTAPA